jgi:hypothetical protein
LTHNAAFHCSNKESCSEVWTAKARRQVTDCRILWKWKWLFVNGFECKGLIAGMMEFLNWCQDGRDSSVCLGIMVINNGTSPE